MEPGRPLAGASSGAAPPKRVFGYFLHEQKVPRRRPGLASTGCKGPPLLWHPNEMGSEKQHLKDAVLGNARASALGFSLLFACAKSRAPPGETFPRKQEKPPGRAAFRLLIYLMVLVSTSSLSIAANCSRLMPPRSSPVRCRGETVAFSMSRSPTTSI